MSAPEEAEPKRETDPDSVMKALELEMIMKRASWQKMRARRGNWRVLSLVFLVLVILGALLAYFYFVTEVRPPAGERRAAGRVETDR